MLQIDTNNHIVKYLTTLTLIKGRKFYYKAVYDRDNNINVAYITPVHPMMGDITTVIFNPSINFELIIQLTKLGQFNYLLFSNMCKIEKTQCVLNCRNAYNPVKIKPKITVVYTRP